MNTAFKYSLTGVVLVLSTSAALWPFLDQAGRWGVLSAGLVALVVQSISFALLVKFRGETIGFMAAWVGGTAVRMLVVATAAVIVIRAELSGAVPTLLALSGFLFGLLLLEPLYFRPGSGETVEA